MNKNRKWQIPFSILNSQMGSIYFSQNFFKNSYEETFQRNFKKNFSFKKSNHFPQICKFLLANFFSSDIWNSSLQFWNNIQSISLAIEMLPNLSLYINKICFFVHFSSSEEADLQTFTVLLAKLMLQEQVFFFKMSDIWNSSLQFLEQFLINLS